MTVHPEVVNLGDEVAGFRVVRLLGSGSRSRVYLGHDGRRPAAVKVMGAGASPESIDDEIAALSSASHAHVVRLRDVAEAHGRPALVFERLESDNVADLLAAPAGLSGGEAVTILAPVVAAVGALHASGVAHGSLSVRRLLFRASGAPVLTGLGHASLFVSAQGSGMTVPVVDDDRRALGEIVRQVLRRSERVAEEPATELNEWLDAVERGDSADGFTDQLQERIFSLARPTPVRRDPAPTAPVSLVPRAAAGAIVLSAGSSAPGTSFSSGQPSRSHLSRWETALRMRLASFLAATPSLSRVLDAARSVRKPFWVVAGLGAACLVGAAVVAVPGGDATPAPVSSPTAVAQPSEGPVTGDDPAAALQQLLQAREDCIRDLSVLCLENVTQSGSAAMDDDATLVRSIESGETAGLVTAAVPGSFVLVERHGDVALVDYAVAEPAANPSTDSAANADQPASALLVRGEAGWRIRDYLNG